MVARRRAPRLVLGAPVAILVALPAFHVGVRVASRVAPPRVHVPDLRVTIEGGVRVAGRGSVRSVGKILEVRLEGSPEEIGAQHSMLLHDEMVETEGVVWKLLDEKVPNRAARWSGSSIGTRTPSC